MVAVGKPGETNQAEDDGPRTDPVRAGDTSLPRGAAVGRYLVLDRLGSGGMGVVYAAYDPELDRKVALKLVRPRGGDGDDADDGARLVREAQAMAQLNHPNVIAVHDVGRLGRQVFVAMELVDGETLTSWLRAEARSWREVRDVFVQAGRGLAAAHEAGLVHRDFKPDNVLVARGGQVKVLDFGLARAAELRAGDPVSEAFAPSPGEVAPAASVLATPLTETGARVGTPGYMAPEQTSGGQVDVRTDQFSFCVALYEGLYRERPFADAAAAKAGTVKLPPRDARVPSWLREVVLRGLRARPEERHPDLRALLRLLEQDQGRLRRRRWLGLGAAAALGAALFGARQLGKGGDPLCRGAERKLGGVWDEARRGAMRAVFTATGLADAETEFSGAARALDDYTRGWTAMHREACEATRLRGEQSEELLDLRMLCLDHALEQVRATTDLFARADAAIVDRAVQTAQSLPDLRACANREALKTPVHLPDDPAARARVEAVYPALAEATALLSAGKYTDGFRVARDVADRARAIGYRPLTARALLRLGDFQEHAGDDRAAEESWLAAAAAAEAGRDDAMAAEAFTGLVAISTSRGAPARSEEWAQLASAALERIGSPAHEEADLFCALGRAYDAGGKYTESVATLRRSVALYEQALGPDHTELARPLWDLGAVLSDQGEYDAASAQLERAVRILERSLGPDHPELARPLSSLGFVVHSQGHNEAALAHLKRALAIQERSLGPDNPDVASTLTNLADTVDELGRKDEAIGYFRRAAAIKEKSLGPWHPSLAITLGNLGDSLRQAGRFDEAQAVLERAVAIKEKALGAKHPSLAFPLTALGNLHVAAKRPARALAPLERALALRQANACDKLDLAETEVALAHALAETGGDRKRARALATEARAAYAGAGERGRENLAKVDAWLAAHP
jgi:eukaryotic-like serine/threonine-protein kinase